MQNTAEKLDNLVHLRNPLKEYIDINNQIKALTKRYSELKESIFQMMDAQHSDSLIIGESKAQRKLKVSRRLDTDKLKSHLGDTIEAFKKDVAAIELVVL